MKRLVLLLALAACRSAGDEGWPCDHDSECNTGLHCHSFHGSNYEMLCARDGSEAVVKVGWLEAYGLYLGLALAGVAGIGVLIRHLDKAKTARRIERRKRMQR